MALLAGPGRLCRASPRSAVDRARSAPCARHLPQRPRPGRPWRRTAALAAGREVSRRAADRRRARRRGHPRPTSLVRRRGQHDGRDRPDRPRPGPLRPAGRSTESSRSRARKRRWSSSSVSAPTTPIRRRSGRTRNIPSGVVNWYDAVAYCAWLDEESHVPVEERCYPPVDQIKEGMQMPRDYLSRTGHRLPTFAEWEYAARALTTTSRYFGERDGLLADYAWFPGNSGDLLHPVGSLKPNALGLFDVYGSMLEWCQESMAFCRKPLSRDVEDPTPATGEQRTYHPQRGLQLPAREAHFHVSRAHLSRDPVGQYRLPRGTYDQEGPVMPCALSISSSPTTRCSSTACRTSSPITVAARASPSEIGGDTSAFERMDAKNASRAFRVSG